MFKTVTVEDIKEALVELLDKNGTTTSNNVKYLLRDKGFWALQDTVSQTLKDVYSEIGCDRSWNGKYFVYTYPAPDDEIEPFFVDNSETDSTSAEDDAISFLKGDTSVDETFKPKKSKVLTSPECIGLNIYKLKIETENEQFVVILSDKGTLESVGELMYEVKDSNNPNCKWYFYCSKPSMVTRHKVLYYSWVILSNEYDSFLKYSDLRSTKACK